MVEITKTPVKDKDGYPTILIIKESDCSTERIDPKVTV